MTKDGGWPGWEGLDGVHKSSVRFRISKTIFRSTKNKLRTSARNEEEQMDSKDKNNVAEFPAPGQELYLPFGATDPDFYIPADCDRRSGGLSRWLRALPVFGRRP